jgi:hypothetical protein
MSSFCFYIPSISAITSAKDVIREFNYIGVVTRVDFAPLGKKPGFKENINADEKSAFVHVAELFTLGKVIESQIQTSGSYKFYISIISSEFWTLLKASKPIQGTMMNTAQIVSNCRYLEKKVEQQAAKLEEQATRLEEQAADIRSLTEKLNGIHSVLYQLLGGLFCQKSQSQTMNDHLEFLFPDSSNRSRRFEESNDSKWDIWPTTRQGDDCERRIEALEKALLETQQVVEQQTEKEDDIELQIQSLEQKLAELTIEPVFTPYEDNGPMTLSELQQDPNEEEDPNEEDEQHRSFVPIPMDQLVVQREYDEDYSISTHSSMPELIYGYISPGSSIPDLESITEDENEMANRGELYKPDEDSQDSEVGF